MNKNIWRLEVNGQGIFSYLCYDAWDSVLEELKERLCKFEAPPNKDLLLLKSLGWEGPLPSTSWGEESFIRAQSLICSYGSFLYAYKEKEFVKELFFPKEGAPIISSIEAAALVRFGFKIFEIQIPEEHIFCGHRQVIFDPRFVLQKNEVSIEGLLS
jgi:hypothetical protein